MTPYRHFLTMPGFAATATILAFILPAAAEAATSDWATNEGGRMRLVAETPDAEGHVRAALQIEPNRGWITYWREPGESGIPPQLTLAPGSKALLEKIGYPTPKLITLGSMREIGYDAPLSLPLTLKANGDGRLDATAFIGVCNEVCIPFQARLSVALPSAGISDAADAAVIDAANAALPEKPSTDFAVGGHTFSADGKTLSLDLRLPEDGGAIPQVYVTGPEGYVFFQQPGAVRSGRDVKATMAIGRLPKNYVAHGKSWGILVVDGSRAMETTIAIE